MQSVKIKTLMQTLNPKLECDAHVQIMHGS
jgi:hypothetical protein